MAIETRILQRKTVFTDWEVKEYIGSGSGGKTAVFRIVRQHGSWEETSALKVINVLEELGKKESLAEVYRQEYEAEREELCKQAGEELRLMSCLRGNSSIVEYYDFAFIDYQEENVFGTDLLIRMELLENLREEQKKKGQYSEAEIIRIGKDICKSLQICHKAGIIHRDIKPANIFVTSWGEYKLGDFGIARMVDAGQKASTKMGTRAYAAPEQFMSHQDKYDKRVDIYSLGLTLYELANHNRLPFAGSGYVRESEIQLRLMGKELPAPDNVSPMVAEVIKKACAHDAERRYTCAEEFWEDLNKAEAGILESVAQAVAVDNGESKEIQKAKEETRKEENSKKGKKNDMNENKKGRSTLTPDGAIVVGLGVVLVVAIVLIVVLGWNYFFGNNEQQGLSENIATGESVEEIVESQVESETVEAIGTEESGETETIPEGTEEPIPEIPEYSMRVKGISDDYWELFGKVASITTSDDNAAVITEAGDLYMWGRNDYGQVGCGNTEEQISPVFVMGNVASVCLSEWHTAAVTTEGELYLWGRNNHSQIGNGETENQLTPTLVMEDVKQVSLGDYHSGALCNNGELYGWGYGPGNGTGKKQAYPKKIANNITSFSLNDCDGAAISEYGDLYVWGMNWTSQSQFVEKFPTKILSEVVSVQVGQTTVAALKANGELYVWGFNDFGQIGNGNWATQSSEPVLIMENVKSMALAKEHTAAITQDGTLYMWGRNDHGQIGISGERWYETPQRIAENVESVYLGDEGSAFIKENGVLYFCGSNSKSQISELESPAFWKVDSLIPVGQNMVAAGVCDEANYGLTAEGRLYRFGEYNVIVIQNNADDE